MPIYALTNYKEAISCWTCSRCGRPIDTGELIYHISHPGVSQRVQCDDCPPPGAEYARESYRIRRERAELRRARYSEHKARTARMAGSNVSDTRGETSADRVQAAGCCSAPTAGDSDRASQTAGVSGGGSR